MSDTELGAELRDLLALGDEEVDVASRPRQTVSNKTEHIVRVLEAAVLPFLHGFPRHA